MDEVEKKKKTKDEAFLRADRNLFQLLVDYQLKPVKELAKAAGELSQYRFFHKLNAFCNRYKCSSQIQILNWKQIGLQSFFILTEDPVEHPYVVRQYKMLGEKVVYLTQCVAPDLNKVIGKYSEIYKIARIYRPTNDIRLLYDEARTFSFVDEWLLNLKEVMVEEEVGDVIYQQEYFSQSPIPVDKAFLEQLSAIYTRGRVGRFDSRGKVDTRDKLVVHSKTIEFIKNFKGFLSTYLDIQIPDMVDYILILDKTKNPSLFVGGFLGKFPLVELYETSNALICRFQIPEWHYAKLGVMLFMHLLEICLPYLWVLLEDTRILHLQEQWQEDHWVPF